MKYPGLLFIACTALVISCNVQGQPRKTVHGNHKVIKTDRTTGSFTGIKVSSGVDVYLKQGDNVSVTVEADENLHEYIKTEVKGEILHVYSDANIRDAEKERVYVTIKDVSSVQTSSAGDVIGESPLKSDHLELSASSAGDIMLEVYTKQLDVDISSSGNIKLNGETEMMKADLSSAGDLKAYDLKTKEANLSVSSAGDADINVSEKLTATASSAGDIYYMGDPKLINVHTSSAGGVHKK